MLLVGKEGRRMTEKEINELKAIYRKTLEPDIAKIMCDNLDKLNGKPTNKSKRA